MPINNSLQESSHELTNKLADELGLDASEAEIEFVFGVTTQSLQ